MTRVVILGGGMAGLTTAWELSQGDWRRDLESITVVQRGWRLGGKGASSRGPHGRIEEHGLHILLGYYDATFRVLREVYAALDRPRTDPSCPIQTWQDALVPAGDVGLADWDGEAWSSFVTRFATTGTLPGEPGAEDRPLQPVDIAARSVQLLRDFHTSMAPPRSDGTVTLSGSPVPPTRAGDVAALVRGAGLTGLAALLAALDHGAGLLGGAALPSSAIEPLRTALVAWRDGLRRSVAADPAARRTWHLVDLVVTNLQGMLADGLLSGSGFERIDHLDYREWLGRHGADPATLDSAIIRGMYDLTFAYVDGDKQRPRFAAGLGLQLAARMLFDFKGSIFWRMQAGMGEIVFAPMYQALVQRGVDFRFFRRIDRLQLTGRTVSAIDLTRQAEPTDGGPDYEPLQRWDDLPCWPARPDTEQLTQDPGTDLESHQWSGDGAATETLEVGRDYDLAVLAVSLGMVPQVAGELIDAEPAWQRMVGEVATVATRSAQLWLRATDAELGWTGPSGVTLSGFGSTFDTWAAMSHLLPREAWPADGPRGLAYFCSALPEDDARAAAPTDRVADTVADFLSDEVDALWPASHDAAGFRWDLLWDQQERPGRERLAAQLVRANTDPSDRYVQSLPGSGRHRIAPGRSGFDNLALAGDWTATGLDAGCLEAATRSGILAARAIKDGTLGTGGLP
jgi:uncharacterized protein with NAD-binding domain and iron-sulfur cluster